MSRRDSFGEKKQNTPALSKWWESFLRGKLKISLSKTDLLNSYCSLLQLIQEVSLHPKEKGKPFFESLQFAGIQKQNLLIVITSKIGAFISKISNPKGTVFLPLEFW